MAPNLNTHILQESSKGFADPFLEEDHGLSVWTSLSGPLKALTNGAVQQRPAGGAVDVAGGQSRLGGKVVHVDPADGEKEVVFTVPVNVDSLVQAEPALEVKPPTLPPSYVNTHSK